MFIERFRMFVAAWQVLVGVCRQAGLLHSYIEAYSSKMLKWQKLLYSTPRESWTAPCTC